MCAGRKSRGRCFACLWQGGRSLHAYQPCTLNVACENFLTRANIPTQAHSLWAMCHGYYTLECVTVGLQTTLEYLQNYQLEVSAGFRSLVIKLSPLQITGSSSPKKSIYHCSIKRLFLNKRRKYCNTLVDTDTKSPIYEQYKMLPNIMWLLTIFFHRLWLNLLRQSKMLPGDSDARSHLSLHKTWI